MATAPQAVPQPLNGEEIRKGIAARIAAEMPTEYAEEIKQFVYLVLGKTCSLEASTGYSKFKADWRLNWWITVAALQADLWVNYELDDFGRVTKGAICSRPQKVPPGATMLTGEIPEVPPDRFRRETSQPIPKPTELKKPDPQQTTFSKSMRGQGKRRDM